MVLLKSSRHLVQVVFTLHIGKDIFDSPQQFEMSLETEEIVTGVQYLYERVLSVLSWTSVTTNC